MRSASTPWDSREFLSSLPDSLRVEVETTRGSLIKRRADGTVDFVSPLPCPYNYGFAVGHLGGDGDPLDVIVLGPRRPAGTRVEVPVIGVVRFVDAGCEDHKVLCGAAMDPSTTRGLTRFFRLYAVAKRLLNRRRALPGPTEFLGVYSREGRADEPAPPR